MFLNWLFVTSFTMNGHFVACFNWKKHIYLPDFSHTKLRFWSKTAYILIHIVFYRNVFLFFPCSFVTFWLAEMLMVAEKMKTFIWYTHSHLFHQIPKRIVFLMVKFSTLNIWKVIFALNLYFFFGFLFFFWFSVFFFGFLFILLHKHKKFQNVDNFSGYCCIFLWYRFTWEHQTHQIPPK